MEAEPVMAIQLFGQAAKKKKSTLQVRLPNDKTIFTKVTVICTYQTTSCQETITIVPNLPTLTNFTIPSYEETRPDIFTQDGAKRTHVFISACDFFLWGYLKSKVYVRKPRTVDDLKVSIREEIATVQQEMLANVTQNYEERLRTCVWQEGRHLSDILFRI